MFNNWFLGRKKKRSPTPKSPIYNLCQFLQIKYSNRGLTYGHGTQTYKKKMLKAKHGAAVLQCQYSAGKGERTKKSRPVSTLGDSISQNLRRKEGKF